MLSLSDPAQVSRLAAQLHRLRRNPSVVWGVLVGGIVVATLIRWAIGGYVLDRIPFTTYYPAILAATLLGGFWLGAIASILSAAVAWGLFMPQAFGFDQAQITSLIAFLLVCFLLVGVVTVLNAAIDLLLVEIHYRRDAHLALGQLGSLVETSEDAIITKDLNGIITSWNKGAENTLSAPLFQLVIMPFRSLVMMASSEVSTREPSCPRAKCASRR